MNLRSKRGQLAIFVIIAIVLVAAALVYFLVRSKIGIGGTSAELSPVYDYYSSCIQEKTKQALDIAGSQGGHIKVDNYIPGSQYAPSSSQLNFLGFPVPYWFYVSGNGLFKENVPTKQQIESEVAQYVTDNLAACNYEGFYAQGYDIQFGKAATSVTINDNQVSVTVNNNIIVSKAGKTATKSVHQVQVNSNFGQFYNEAIQIYNKEKRDNFLENYSVDFLRSYAPVDGVETSCSPKIWKTTDVESELKSGLQANIAAIRFRNGGDKYFVAGNVKDNVNLMYSTTWPTKINVFGDNVDNSLMIAQPLGNDQGLGMMGFCYIPYHFVYDLSYPVLVQVYNDNEIFQFPVVVVLDKNVPRKAEQTQIQVTDDVDLCAYKTQDIDVKTYDVNLNSVDAQINYQCLNQECSLGQTTNGEYIGKAPACVGGQIIARADNYADATQQFSTNNQSTAELIMDRLYNDTIKVEVGGKEVTDGVIVSFENKDNGKVTSAILPEVNNVNLPEGTYDIKVYVYGNSSVTIPASTKRQCATVPKAGVLGFFGGTEERCVDVTVPATTVDAALIGGGQTETYFLTSDLEKGVITLKAQALPAPTTMEQLQYNFDSFDSLNLEVGFG